MPHPLAFPAAGVALFFVLSGFLITSLLVEEHEERGTVRISSFYGRRARRLLPAFAVVAVVSLVAMVLIGQAHEGVFDAVIAASYVGNWVMAGGQWLGPLSQTWSLAIEEQFYLLWPLILVVPCSSPEARPLTDLALAPMCRRTDSSSAVRLRCSFTTDESLCPRPSRRWRSA